MLWQAAKNKSVHSSIIYHPLQYVLQVCVELESALLLTNVLTISEDRQVESTTPRHQWRLLAHNFQEHQSKAEGQEWPWSLWLLIMFAIN